MFPSLGCFEGGFVPGSSSHSDMQCHEECAIFALAPLCSGTHSVEKLSFDCRLSKSRHYCYASVSYEKAFDKDESLVITQMVLLILHKSSALPPLSPPSLVFTVPAGQCRISREQSHQVTEITLEAGENLTQA